MSQPASSPVASGRLCICGAPAPADLPEPGAPPVRCSACDTPLVSPGPVASGRVQAAFAAASVVAIVCALGWLLASRVTGTGAPLVVAVAGGLVGAAARACSRARGTTIQAAALAGFVLFVGLGEALLFERSLQPRLVAMHAREGVADPEMYARQELERVRSYSLDRKLEHFLHIEATLGLFVAVAAGGALALWVTRAPPAVAAFDRPAARHEEPASEGAVGDAVAETSAPRSGADGGDVSVSAEPIAPDAGAREPDEEPPAPEPGEFDDRPA